MKAIVAVKFDDGTEATVPDMETLKRYISSFLLQRGLRALAADTTIDWPAISKAAEQRKAITLTKKATKRANASKPRNPITKADLIKHRDAHEKKYHDLRGWTKTARIDLGIDAKTLKKRMAE